MAVYILNQQMLPAPELIVAMTGSQIAIGTLLHPAVKLIIDNQSSTAVVISIDVGGGPIQWKTFSGGEMLVLDNDLYTFPRGTIIYGNGAANGSVSVSYTYINYP